MVYAPDKDWAQKVIDQMAAFPKAAHDDLTDTAVGAIRYLRKQGLLERSDEIAHDLHQQMAYPGSPKKPLYPC